MNRIWIPAVVSLICVSPTVGRSLAAPEPTTRPAPQVEVAFVLDTTGSMGGLIAGAKAKIWYIANQIVLGEPKPIVRMALVGYRDKGDDYVTRLFDLTDNIDQVYTDLMKFQAAGGGDTPENVNQALHDAVHKLSWSADTGTLKIIYLVGDCPPHNEYKDVPTYDVTAKAAIEKGIYINTVLCGNNGDARKVWKDLAARAEGEFLAIAQDGGVQHIDTPFDAELSRLNADLLGTAVVYGDEETRARQAKLNAAAVSYSAPAGAARAVFSAGSGKAADNELLDEYDKVGQDVANLTKENLPEPLQTMSASELKAHIDGLQAKRDKINARIKELAAKRAQYVKAELAKAKGTPIGFDAKVVESLKVQAAKKNIRYK